MLFRKDSSQVNYDDSQVKHQHLNNALKFISQNGQSSNNNKILGVSAQHMPVRQMMDYFNSREQHNKPNSRGGLIASQRNYASFHQKQKRDQKGDSFQNLAFQREIDMLNEQRSKLGSRQLFQPPQSYVLKKHQDLRSIPNFQDGTQVFPNSSQNFSNNQRSQNFAQMDKKVGSGTFQGQPKQDLVNAIQNDYSVSPIVTNNNQRKEEKPPLQLQQFFSDEKQFDSKHTSAKQSIDYGSRESLSDAQDQEYLEYADVVNNQDHEDDEIGNLCHNHGFERIEMGNKWRNQNRSAPKMSLTYEEDSYEQFANANNKQKKRSNSDFKLLCKTAKIYKNKKQIKGGWQEYRIQSAVTAHQNDVINKVTVIKGHYKGIAYKLQKNSKFIQNTERINQKLNHTVHNQLKRDAVQHGTYSLNPFAFYPKNLKNTLSSIMGDHLSQENKLRMNNAFEVQVQKNGKDNSANKIQEKTNQSKYDEVKQKKRCLTSSKLDTSFHVKQVFKIWYQLHSKYQFELIAQHLIRNISKSNIPIRPQISIIKNVVNDNSEYYKFMKLEHKEFKKKKDLIISQLNEKYTHMTRDMQNYCFTSKKPQIVATLYNEKLNILTPRKLPKEVKADLKDAKNDTKVVKENGKKDNDKKNGDNLKTVDSNEEVEEKTMKERVAELEEKKKKTFFQYMRWLNSFYNENNINFDPQMAPLFLRNYDEYFSCCTKEGLILQQQQNQPVSALSRNQKQRRFSSRVQSAKSGITRSNNLIEQNRNSCSKMNNQDQSAEKSSGQHNSSSKPMLHKTKSNFNGQQSNRQRSPLKQDKDKPNDFNINDLYSLSSIFLEQFKNNQGYFDPQQLYFNGMSYNQVLENLEKSYRGQHEGPPKNLLQYESYLKQQPNNTNKLNQNSFKTYVQNLQKMQQQKDNLIDQIQNQTNVNILGEPNQITSHNTSKTTPYPGAPNQIKRVKSNMDKSKPKPEVISHSNMSNENSLTESNFPYISNDRLDIKLNSRDQRHREYEDSKQYIINRGCNKSGSGAVKLNELLGFEGKDTNSGDRIYEYNAKQCPVNRNEQLRTKSSTAAQSRDKGRHISEQLNSKKMSNEQNNKPCKVITNQLQQKFEYRNGVLTKELITKRVYNVEQNCNKSFYNQNGKCYQRERPGQNNGRYDCSQQSKIKSLYQNEYFGVQVARELSRHLPTTNTDIARKPSIEMHNQLVKTTQPQESEQIEAWGQQIIKQSIGNQQQKQRPTNIQYSSKEYSQTEQRPSDKKQKSRDDQPITLTKQSRSAQRGYILREQHEQALLKQAQTQTKLVSQCHNVSSSLEKQRNTEPKVQVDGTNKPNLISNIQCKNHQRAVNLNAVLGKATPQLTSLSIETEHSHQKPKSGKKCGGQLAKRLASAKGRIQSGNPKRKLRNNGIGYASSSNIKLDQQGTINSQTQSKQQQIAYVCPSRILSSKQTIASQKRIVIPEQSIEHQKYGQSNQQKTTCLNSRYINQLKQKPNTDKQSKITTQQEQDLVIYNGQGDEGDREREGERQAQALNAQIEQIVLQRRQKSIQCANILKSGINESQSNFSINGIVGQMHRKGLQRSNDFKHQQSYQENPPYAPIAFRSDLTAAIASASTGSTSLRGMQNYQLNSTQVSRRTPKQPLTKINNVNTTNYYRIAGYPQKY